VDGDELVVLAGDPMFSGYDTTGERVPLSEAKLLAPVIPRSKVVCVGLNYADHKADMHTEGPEAPLLFLKPNTSVVGPGDEIVIPPVDGRIVHEGEIAMVVGRIAKQVKAADFADYVFGYTIANDVSARDQMFIDGQWARAKGYDTFCPIGPWIVTDLDPTDLDLRTEVNGEVKQHSRTSLMIHDIGAIVEWISAVMTLLPGDLILTGTPEGVGPIEDGDTVSITIEGIGTLSNPVVRKGK
jgi:2-keto-4-pentenoate hydratase/2-oxohepta-3-ene-1,7-dioic acid hydratase in catechol pathway